MDNDENKDLMEKTNVAQIREEIMNIIGSGETGETTEDFIRGFCYASKFLKFIDYDQCENFIYWARGILDAYNKYDNPRY